MTWVLDLENVSVRRGTKNIVDNLNWQVKEGERWIVLGRNGAGKTTLMQLSSTRMHPTSGTVKILGEQMGKVDIFEVRPRIGLASAALAERIPGDELVLDVVLTAAYGITGRWREEYDDFDRERATDLMAAFGVDGFQDRHYGTLSEGERKRVQIARALMTDPELLLLDEPAAGLDLGGREELLAALSELAAYEAAPVLVLVTHHVEEIPPGFTHLLLLKDGSEYAAGPIDEVLTDENLTGAFDVPLTVTKTGDRYSARASQKLPVNLGGHA
ncbi:ABC transporter ATP-binding protein [Timonella senegalensis]|uniref:ABC transporter ATP-binding protein n=1 Tax=Timonella senegalensis TaxID=1465825 RepID=UPI000592B99A|nr:ABC transporter ATP-binding protein [Timonella senegalensis]